MMQRQDGANAFDKRTQASMRACEVQRFEAGLNDCLLDVEHGCSSPESIARSKLTNLYEIAVTT
jgi:hypothetical protein